MAIRYYSTQLTALCQLMQKTELADNPYLSHSILSQPGPSSAPLGQSNLSSQIFSRSMQTPGKAGHSHLPGGQEAAKGAPQPKKKAEEWKIIQCHSQWGQIINEIS